METATSVNQIIRDTVIVIQLTAGVVGTLSLWKARSFYDLQEKHAWGLIILTCLVVGFSLLLVRWLDVLDMVKWVALLDCVLLAILLHYTGGPTQSWFTPFLLVLLPLKIMLEERAGGHNARWSTILLVLTAVILLYQLFGNWMVIAQPTIHNRFQYHLWYFTTIGFTVFFPPMVNWGLLAKLGTRLLPIFRPW